MWTGRTAWNGASSPAPPGDQTDPASTTGPWHARPSAPSTARSHGPPRSAFTESGTSQQQDDVVFSSTGAARLVARRRRQRRRSLPDRVDHPGHQPRGPHPGSRSPRTRRGFQVLVPGFDAKSVVIGNEGTTFLVQTDREPTGVGSSPSRSTTRAERRTVDRTGTRDRRHPHRDPSLRRPAGLPLPAGRPFRAPGARRATDRSPTLSPSRRWCRSPANATKMPA